MIELYLDTVDTEQINRLNLCLPIKGVTTNPSILANAGIGVTQALSELAEILEAPRFHVQVVSQTVKSIVEEATEIEKLPFDMVVKIPATEVGCAAIKLLKKREIQILATAIYSSQQGFFAALSGADYLAPYINRIESIGGNGINVVAELQHLLTLYNLNCKLLPASFKNTLQVMEVMKLGVEAITLPVNIATQMMTHPAVIPAINQFNQDWKETFGSMLSFES